MSGSGSSPNVHARPSKRLERWRPSRLLYLYDDIALDVDNILKPILDALIGVLLEDDSVITDVEIRRRWRGASFTFNAIPPVLAAALSLDREFVYVALSDAPAQDVLP